MFFEHCGSEPTGAGPPFRTNSCGVAYLAKFGHQHCEVTAFECAVLDHVVGQSSELVSDVLGRFDDGALGLVTDAPIGNSLHESRLEEPECLINGAARSLQYLWLWSAPIYPRDAEILSLLISDRVFAPEHGDRSVLALPRIHHFPQLSRRHAAQDLRRVIAKAVGDENCVFWKVQQKFKTIRCR